ncbi:hypothetical protein Tco_0895869, partial [Tanacetum coccineum]
VSHDAVMLRVFPITLTGAAKRWMDRLPPGTIDSWDLLKKAFIQRYCPPSKTAKQLETIHNFKQEGDETLYQAWEWYNDLLYKCPTHDINSHQKINIFYNGLGTMNRQLLESQGPIPGMKPAQALTAIQTMADVAPRKKIRSLFSLSKSYTSTLCSLFRAHATATVGSCPWWSVTNVETMGLAAATATLAAKWVAKLTATPLVRPSSTSCLTIKLRIMWV